MVSIPKLTLFMKAVDFTFAIRIKAGLPNITGLINSEGGSCTGAFRFNQAWSANYNPGSEIGHGTVSFNASYSNSTYGSSTKVSPLSISTLHILKY